jgi:hypothetical protein
MVSILGIYLKECKSEFNRYSCTPMFIAALFPIAKLWKQPKFPTIDEWIMKMWYMYIIEYYSFIKKNVIM